MAIETALRAAAEDGGLIGFGICGSEPFPEARADLDASVASGRSAGLGFTFSDPGRSTAPTESFPWARSLVVGAHAYLPAAGDPGDSQPGTGRIARFATEDHYRPLRAGLDRIAWVLTEAGHRAEILCDDNRLVDRAAAVRSGVGWWGKSTMVLAPGVGPWMLLGTVVTDAELESTSPMRRSCGTCDACIPACPTGAIVAPGILDARRCLAAVAQSPGEIPRELREPMGDRFYGCDDCLTACPPGDRLVASSTDPAGRIELREVVGTADRPLRARFDHFYVPRHDGRYLRRNAIVALGNVGERRDVGLLAGLLGHPDRLLRLHAAWSLGRVGGEAARAVLDAAARMERDEEVRNEIAVTIGTLG